MIPTSDWLPIATAPKDGTEILACDGYDRAVCHWDDVNMGGLQGWQVGVVTDGEWNHYLTLDDPTHWMPLPELPR